MKNIYIIYFTHGEYNDYVAVPIGFTDNEDEAKLLIIALENREMKYVKKIPEKLCGYNFDELMNPNFIWRVYISTIPRMSI